MGTIWELIGKSSPHPFKMIKKHPLGTCLRLPIGSPCEKNKKHTGGHVGATQLALLTGLILKCFFVRTSYYDRCFPCMEFAFNKLRRGQGEKIRWSS